MKIFVHLWYYLAACSEWCFRQKLQRKSKHPFYVQ